MKGFNLPCYQTDTSAGAPAPAPSSPSTPAPDDSVQIVLADATTPFLMLCKTIDPWQSVGVRDSLLSIHADGTPASDSIGLAEVGVRSRLLSDRNGNVYQLSHERGLLGITDQTPIIPPSALAFAKEPRYQAGATVCIGYLPGSPHAGTLPIHDVAFDTEGYAYVAPVVVVPTHRDGAHYNAVAKLRVTPGQTSPYQIVQIFDGEGVSDNGLYDIEVSAQGALLLLNTRYAQGKNDLWIFDPQRGATTESIRVDRLSGLYASRRSRKLYAYSSVNAPDAAHTTLFVLDTDDLDRPKGTRIMGMGHITDITEDPDTGMLWVIGVAMPTVPTQDAIHSGAVLNQAPFIKPCIANVDPDKRPPVTAIDLSELFDDWTIPTSIIWKGKL